MNDERVFYETDDLEKALAYRIHRSARVLRLHLSRFLALNGLDISQEQYFILFKVRAKPGSSQADLADEVLSDHPNVTRLVDSLVVRGYLERKADPRDRRRHAVFLTDSGVELMDRLIPAVIEARRELYDGIPPADLGVFVRVLSTIERHATEKSVDMSNGKERQ